LKDFKYIIDLSMRIRSLDTPVFPGYPAPVSAKMKTLEEDGYYACIWNLVEHIGTHVDAPAHFVKKGRFVDQIPLSTFICEGIILDFRDKEPRYQISVDDVKRQIGESLNNKSKRGAILLFLTGYSSYAGMRKWFDYPELSPDACKYIVNKKFKAIGTDAPSPDRDPFQAHRILLPKGVVIFENLVNLEKLVGKEFLFIGVPLPLFKGSASPVRALALVR
jgi:arylformamidase